MRKYLVMPLCLLLFILLLAVNASAQSTQNKLEYQVENEQVIITNYSGYDSHLTVPAEIEGFPVVSIGSYAFAESFTLVSVQLPDTITRIESYAFERCSSLESINLPPSLQHLGTSSFASCSNLKSITFPEGMSPPEDSAFVGSGLTSVVLPKSFTYISSGLFAACHNLSQVSIPSTTTEIRSSAFSSCTSLQSITIPNGVTSIGEDAFSGCTSLASLRFPSSLNTVFRSSFYSCSSLSSIEVDSSNPSYSSLDGVLYNKDKTVLVLYPMGKKHSTFTVPSGVVEIGVGAFEKNNSLEQVNFPDSVLIINGSAFNGCSNLQKLSAPAVLKIGAWAFANCSSLESIHLPSIRDFGQNAFEYCSNLTDIVLSQSISTIGYSCFSGCSSLSKLVISTGVIGIGERAFQYCYNLKDVYIGASVTGIHASAFSDPAHFTIHGYSGSYAETFANSKSIAFAPFSVVITGGPYLYVGSDAKLNARLSNPYTSAQNTSWSVDAPDIASIDETGTIKAHQPGTVLVTATMAADITYQGTINLEVVPPLTGLSLNANHLYLVIDEWHQMEAITEPANAKSLITWFVDSENVVEISDKGLARAFGQGTAVITATAGEFSASCTVYAAMPMSGDANGDGVINHNDILKIIEHLVDGQHMLFKWNADIDNQTGITVSDLSMIIAHLVEGTILPPIQPQPTPFSGR